MKIELYVNQLSRTDCGGYIVTYTSYSGKRT